MKSPLRRSSGTSRLASRLQARRSAIAARPRVYAAIFAIAVLLFISIAWPFVSAHLQSIAVLDQVANKPVPALLRPLATEHIVTSEITLPLPSGTVRARLYTPRNHPYAPAIVVLHGVHYLGMDEPRMIAFASSLASCGLRVLTPELPGIKDYHVDEHTVAVIGDSAHWLYQQDGNRQVGILGLSFSGRPLAHSRRRPTLAPVHQVCHRRRFAGQHGPRRRLLPHRQRPHVRTAPSST